MVSKVSKRLEFPNNPKSAKPGATQYFEILREKKPVIPNGFCDTVSLQQVFQKKKTIQLVKLARE